MTLILYWNQNRCNLRCLRVRAYTYVHMRTHARTRGVNEMSVIRMELDRFVALWPFPFQSVKITKVMILCVYSVTDPKWEYSDLAYLLVDWWQLPLISGYWSFAGITLRNDQKQWFEVILGSSWILSNSRTHRTQGATIMWMANEYSSLDNNGYPRTFGPVQS